MDKVKVWFNNIRAYENLEYGGAKTLGDIEKEYDRLVAENKKLKQRSEASPLETIISGSFPDEEQIENKALDYVEDEIYISTGEGHDTCREWAFVAGAKWMREQIKK